MTRPLPVILLFLILYISCNKVDNNKDIIHIKYDIPNDYPTTCNIVPIGILSEKQSSFAIKNPFTRTSLNEFGFCGYFGDLLSVGTPPFQGTITKSEAMDLVKDFISINASETGVKNKTDISFSRISTYSGYGGAIRWNFSSNNQNIDTIEVLNSMIQINLTNSKVTSCTGHWFPEILIPTQFNINQALAKNLFDW